MKAWKLTNEKDRTLNETQWGENTTHTTSGKGPLCSSGWLHFYRSPVLAVLMNPIHAGFDPSTMHLWECEAEGELLHDGQAKSGCTRLTTIKRIPVPEVTAEQRVEVAICCALKVYDEPSFVEWANGWLSGKRPAIRRVPVPANDDADTYAAYAAYAADAAYAATKTVYATHHVATCAAHAAANAVEAAAYVDLIQIIDEVCK